HLRLALALRRSAGHRCNGWRTCLSHGSGHDAPALGGRIVKVLFVCIQNAGRSQIAQALAERAGLEARSAGSNPAQHVHPEVADAMDELGIDIRGRKPHALTQADAEWADVV